MVSLAYRLLLRHIVLHTYTLCELKVLGYTIDDYKADIT
jgi:hypothetical protein